MLSGQRSLTNAARFADVFHGGSAKRHADRAQISRWERGLDPAGFSVITRYEQLLDLRRGSITAICHHIYREIHHGGGKPALQPLTPPQSQTAELLHKAAGHEHVTGHEWDQLSCGIAATRSRRVSPQVTEALQRLITELPISNGHGWLLRSEAVHRLTRHETLQPAVVMLCSSSAADPHHQILDELFSILEAARHPLAARHVLTAVVSPTSEPARHAGWWSAAEKLTRGHFTAAEKQTLVHQAMQLLTQGGTVFARAAAADVLRRANAASAVARRIQRTISHDDVASSVYTTGMITPDPSDIVNRLIHATQRDNSHDWPHHDSMFNTLIKEMLTHPHTSRRVIAAHTLAATPYRQPLGTAITDLLHNRGIHTNPKIAVPMIHALMALGDINSRHLAETIALDITLPAAIRNTAIRSLSHIAWPRLSPQSFWTRLLTNLANNNADPRAVTYAAGIAKQPHILKHIHLHPDIPATAKPAASWWLNLPHTNHHQRAGDVRGS